MTNPHRTFTAIIGIAEQLAANLGAHIGVELALAPDVLRAASLTGGSRSSDVPDPTGTIATTLTSRGHLRDTTSSWPEFIEDAERVLVILRRMQTRQATCIRQDPAVARDADATARALRCDGSVDPLCTRNAVRAGVCWSCYQKRRRDTMRATGTSDVVDSLSVEPSAPQTAFGVVSSDATCGRCGASFHGTDADDLTRQLAEHHATSCAA